MIERYRSRSCLGLRTFLALAFVLAAVPVWGQVRSAPTFFTDPRYPPAGQPFDAMFRVYAHAAAIGFWSDAPYDISGNTITVAFDSGCGFICPGGSFYYRSFHLHLPALPAGRYTIRFVDGVDLNAQFPLIVGGTAPVGAPLLTPAGWLCLILLLLFAGGMNMKRRTPLTIPSKSRSDT